jgi:hypothetical protein
MVTLEDGDELAVKNIDAAFKIALPATECVDEASWSSAAPEAKDG